MHHDQLVEQGAPPLLGIEGSILTRLLAAFQRDVERRVEEACS
jgi:hypothetical protein